MRREACIDACGAMRHNDVIVINETDNCWNKVNTEDVMEVGEKC